MSYPARAYSSGASEEGGGSSRSGTLPDESRECLLELRQKWIPHLDSVFSSGVDAASDWYYLYTVYWGYTGGELMVPSENLNLLIPLLAVTIISSIFFVLTAITYCTKAGDETRKVCCVDSLKKVALKCMCRRDMDTRNFLALMEDILEDIPSIVLTGMIEIRRDGVSPAGVLNLTTSCFNMVYNLLNLLLPKKKQE